MVDNVATVTYINRLGGTNSSALLELMILISELARRLDCRLVAKHIAGKLNVVADLASRVGLVVTSEWQLSPEAFSWGC